MGSAVGPSLPQYTVGLQDRSAAASWSCNHCHLVDSPKPLPESLHQWPCHQHEWQQMLIHSPASTHLLLWQHIPPSSCVESMVLWSEGLMSVPAPHSVKLADLVSLLPFLWPPYCSPLVSSVSSFTVKFYWFSFSLVLVLTKKRTLLVFYFWKFLKYLVTLPLFHFVLFSCCTWGTLQSNTCIILYLLIFLWCSFSFSAF